MNVLRLTAEVDSRIREHGALAYPQECCGALLGRADPPMKLVTDVIPLENIRQENRERRFLVAGADYLRVEREAESRGLALLGFYHSHPDHPAAPSPTDLEAAFPWFSTVILAVEKGTPREMTSWTLADERDRFLEERLDRVDTATHPEGNA